MRRLRKARHGEDVLGSRVIRLVRGSGLGEELLEVFEEIGGGTEQARDLGVNVLYGLLFSLVGLKDFEELFVDFRFILKSVL